MTFHQVYSGPNRLNQPAIDRLMSAYKESVTIACMIIHYALIKLRTLEACHWRPIAVGICASFSADAMLRRDWPALRNAVMTGIACGATRAVASRRMPALAAPPLLGVG